MKQSPECGYSPRRSLFVPVTQATIKIEINKIVSEPAQVRWLSIVQLRRIPIRVYTINNDVFYV
jgi:hypothetical protein